MPSYKFGASVPTKPEAASAASKETKDGLKLFVGGEFDDWLRTVFTPFLQRRKLARVLDPERDPRKLYDMPDLPESHSPPPTVSSGRATRTPRTSVGRSQSPSGASDESPKSQRALQEHQRFVAQIQGERRVIQEKYSAWDDDCDAAYGYLHSALFPEAQRLADRQTNLIDAIAALASEYKLKTTHQKTQRLIRFCNSQIRCL